jgi:dolichol-phosphate mannosyltransferase
MNKNLVIIPAYNEEETIYKVVTQALKYADVSVTDDGSGDRTSLILREVQSECKKGCHSSMLNIITHPKPTHIPRGIQDGLQFGLNNGYDLFVTMDAGLSHDPEILPDFFEFDSAFDVVIGARKNTKNVPLYRQVISKLAAVVVNYAFSNSYLNLYGPGIKDCTSGFRRYGRRAATKIANSQLRSVSFDFHMEALSLCVRDGMKVAEIPIHYVFSNSSFNRKVLWQAMKFGIYLLMSKKNNQKHAMI